MKKVGNMNFTHRIKHDRKNSKFKILKKLPFLLYLFNYVDAHVRV